MTKPRATRWTLGLLVLLAAGYAIPRLAVGPGLGPYRDDSYARAAAARAYESAWMLNDNPIGRVLFPAARVTRVWRDAGHCPAGDPGGAAPLADYRATVRFHGWFALPGPTVHTTCGGDAARW